jgi:hypothetical protein
MAPGPRYGERQIPVVQGGPARPSPHTAPGLTLTFAPTVEATVNEPTPYEAVHLVDATAFAMSVAYAE